MVFEQRQQDAVTRAQVGHAPGLRNQVDRLGRTARKHQFMLMPADQRRDVAPRRFIGRRHFGRSRIQPAMHRRIIGAKRARDRIDHHIGLLRGGRAVEIMPARAFARDEPRKCIRCMRGDFREQGHTIASSAASASTVNCSSFAAPANASARKACSISALAAAGGIPRLAR